MDFFFEMYLLGKALKLFFFGINICSTICNLFFKYISMMSMQLGWNLHFKLKVFYIILHTYIDEVKCI